VVVATKGTAVLRHAADADLEAVDALTVESYRPIFESYVSMLGEVEHGRGQPIVAGDVKCHRTSVTFADERIDGFLAWQVRDVVLQN